MRKERKPQHIRTGRSRGRPKKFIPIVLHKAQEDIVKLTKDKRFVFVCAGRRFGKTTLSSKVIKDIVEGEPDKIIWYVAPTLKTAKDLMWLRITNLIPKQYIKKISKQENNIYMFNGSQICIRGSDREDNLRGRGLDYVVMEEFAFHKSGVWELIIRPQLADRKGGALFIGTPSMKKGVHYRQLHDYAKGNKNPEWGYAHYTIYDNPYISREEIEEIKKTASDTAWKQEYMAEFVEEEGVVYYEFNDIKNIFNPAVSYRDINKRTGICGIDWGLSDNTGAVWCHIANTGEIVVTKEHLQNNWTPTQQAAEIKRKSANHNINYFALDRTAFKRESVANNETMKFNSVAKSFRENGVPVRPSEFWKGDGIAIMKGFLIGDRENSWIKVSSHCPNLIRGLKEWQHGSHEPDIVSALRYAVSYIWKRKLTPLAEKIDLLAKDIQTNPKEEVENIDPKINRLRYAKPIQWNYEYGVPE